MGLEIPAGVASAVHELEERERRFRAVFESALDAIVIFDDGGRVLEANFAAAVLFGVSHEALAGRRLGEFSPSLEEGQRLWAELRSSGRLQGEFDIVRHNGERRIVESSVTADIVLGQHVGVIRDVTDRRSEERERLRLAERFGRLFRTDLVGMMLINRQMGRVEDCNHKLAEFFGRAPQDFIGRRVADIADFFSDRDRYQQLLLAWASGAPLRGLPIESALPDGTKRYGLATFESLPGVESQGPVDVAVVIDVTEQHRLEAELRQAQRLEAIGRLAGGIAHDFNNLLAVISGYCALLDTTLGDNLDGRESVEEIRTAASRAVKLTHGLLAFSRQEAFDVRTVDLHDVIRRCAGALQEMFGPQVQLELQLSAGNPHIRTDALQLEHLLMQLAANSRDAMPDGGTFTVVTTDDGRDVRLSIQDSGKGMEPATLERAFEPFFTTKSSGDGSGLGLSTVYGIVTQSGGRVAAESEASRGTTVHVFLPAVDGALPVESPADAVPQVKPIVGTETILLVEEETSVALLIESFLSRLGYRVVYASSSQEALRTAAAYGDALDLVISGIGTAARPGGQFLEELRRERPDLPAVLVSGFSPTPHGLPCSNGTTTTLTKPFSMSDLAAAARTLLDA
jgi:two-component system cell cycle sensor histidine kinase/response regulator CckA